MQIGFTAGLVIGAVLGFMACAMLASGRDR